MDMRDRAPRFPQRDFRFMVETLYPQRADPEELAGNVQGDEDVVQALAYCKTAEVEETFKRLGRQLDWPWITVVCDICRDDLLFEVEAIAMPKKR